MSLNTKTGVYTPVSGAENAFTGESIASATWNAINTDYANAFNTFGTQQFTGSIIQFKSLYTNVSVSTGATDFRITVPTSLLPSGVYKVNKAIFFGQSQSLTSTVYLYTGPLQTGTQIISASLITLTGSAGTANSVAVRAVLSTAGTNTFTTMTNNILYLNVSVAASAGGTIKFYVQYQEVA